MAKYELIISLHKDDNPLPSKKEGDLVGVKEYPATWGRKEIDGWLIVIVESSKTLEQMQALCAQRVYRDSKNKKLISAKDVCLLVRPNGSRNISEFEEVYKSRYKISFDDLSVHCPGIELVKVRDSKKIYQPFKKASHLVTPFDGLNGRRFVTLAEVETATASVGSEDEVTIDFKILSVFDKLKDEWTDGDST